MIELHRMAGALAIVLLSGLAMAGQAVTMSATGMQPSVISPAGRTKVLYDESHALLSSASNYSGTSAGGWPKLPNTAGELDSVAEALRPHGFTVTRVYDPTGDELVRAFRQFTAQHGQKRNVRLFVFFSGHGYTNPGNDFGYLVPVDAKDPRSDPVDFYTKALPIQQIELWAREVLSKHALFIFDSCFSGSIFSTKSAGSRPEPLGGNASDRWQFLQGKSQDPVRQFIAAGGANEVLPGRSQFVPLLVRGLRYGVPSQADGYVTGKGLGQWIEESVPSLTGGRQNPHSGVIRDSALALGDMVFQIPVDSLAASSPAVLATPSQPRAVEAPRPVGVPSVAPGTIRVGILHSLSGTMAISETVLKDAILMEIDAINANGGLLGKKLEAVVVDTASNWPLFAEKARQLISKDNVAVIFGCWTSVSRKSVLPVVEKLNGLLFYPVQYEGEELSKNVFYTGAAPNQQAIPAVEYLMSKDGGSAKRFVLLGTDYVYPRTTNKILRAFLQSKGIKDEDIMEEYTTFGHSDYQSIIAKIKKFAAEGKKTAVVSTINGDSNVPFYEELGNQGLKATDMPVVALSVGEEELRGVDTKPLVGHLAAWNYFMSIKNPTNDEFIKRWTAYAKAKGIAGHKDKALTNDPMEASVIGFHMWAQAVTKAKSTDTDDVIAAMAGQTYKAPSGITSMMDAKNHHLHKSVFIGEIKADGQFNVLWKTPGPVKAQPWSPFIPENKGKRDEPVTK